MDGGERLDKMTRLVFNAENLRQLKDGLVSMIDLFGEVLEQPTEHGACFSHDDVMDRLEKIDQQQWRAVRNQFLQDPYYGYSQGEFTDDEGASPAKIMLDFVNACDQIRVDLKNNLEHYQIVIKTLIKEKTDLEVSVSRLETLLREERSSTSKEKLELTTARDSIVFWEGLVQSKNETIANLQREQNVQLWEREKVRIFAETENKIQALEQEVVEQKRVNDKLVRRVTNLDEANRMLRMKHDLAKGSLPLASTRSQEDLGRTVYLLEKDVVVLEQMLYTQQRSFATVLCGLKTDLLILNDHTPSWAESTSKSREFGNVCTITSDIFKAMLEGDLIETLKSLPPHYSYLPSEFKIKRVKRVSRPRITAPHYTAKMEALPVESGTEVKAETTQNQDDQQEEPIKDNPRLIDPTSRTINSTRCMQYFPHMSQDSIREHWAKFQEFDVDSNECLDFSEVVKALMSMGFQFTAQQVEEAMMEADINRNRTLDFYEYLVVSDKLFSKKGHAELFHTGAAKDNRKVIAKTCTLQ